MNKHGFMMMYREGWLVKCPKCEVRRTENKMENWRTALDHARRNKKLLGAPGIATRNKDATRGSWPYY